MEMSLSTENLKSYVLNLLTTHFPDGYKVNYSIDFVFSTALERIEYNFSHIRRKYYFESNKVVFNHLNSDHMATLLYFLANTIWREVNDTELPTRLFYLNKIMHGIDLYYSVPMPNIFMLVHPIGTILGKASYEDYLVIYQNVTVGADTDIYPRFGKEVILYSRSSVLGDCNIGNNVILAANSFLINTAVSDNTVVVGQFPNHKLIQNHNSVRSRCFD